MFRLYELNNEEFEALTVQLCLQFLGTGVFSFAPGKDGGRDGRFEGTAKRYPSEASPHSGKFVIQAKHTRNAGASCSDGEFTRIFKQELHRVRRLARTKEVDHYLLFTNRRLTGLKDEKLRNKLSSVRFLKSGVVIARESITSWLTSKPMIWRKLDFDRGELPFRVRPSDLVAVIRAFRGVLEVGSTVAVGSTNFTYVRKTKKNRINKLSEEYYDYIQDQSLPHFGRVKQFLEDPRNEALRNMYHDAADDLKSKIITFRGHFSTFDEILTYLYDQIVDAMPEDEGRKRLVKVFLHYMYFDCDIGRHA